MARKFILIRDVLQDECSWLGRDFLRGEFVYEYTKHTYGCISPGALAISEEMGLEPFLEMPTNAVTEVKPVNAW